MNAKLEKKLQAFEFDGAEGADEDAIAQVEIALGKVLPVDFREILTASDGLMLWNDWHEIQIWKCEDIIAFNKANQVQKYTPGFLMFGSNGRGETYTLDYRKNPAEIVLTPAIGFDYESAIAVAKDFSGLLDRLEKEEPLL